MSITYGQYFSPNSARRAVVIKDLISSKLFSFLKKLLILFQNPSLVLSLLTRIAPQPSLTLQAPTSLGKSAKWSGRMFEIVWE